MLYEDLLTHISKSGPCYRWCVSFLIGFLTMKMALNMFVLNLATSNVPYHCAQAIVGNETLSLATVMNNTISNNFSAFDFTCTKPVFERVQDGVFRLIKGGNDSGLRDQLEKCTSWSFHPDPPSRWSMMIEYEMVCDKKYLADRIQTVYQFGALASALIGPLGDIAGRKTLMITFCYLDFVCSVGLIFAHDLTVQMVLRFFMGFEAQALRIGIMLIIEIVGEEYRGLHGNLFWVLWVFGYSGSAAISYLVYNWRLQLVIIVIIIGIGYATYIPLVPESPRWLLTRGRTKRAKRIMKEICKFSGCKEVLENFNFEKNEIVDEAREHAENKRGIYRFIPKENLCKIKYLVTLCVISFSIFTTQLIYTALSLQRDFIVENAYVNVVISGVVELPAYVVAWQMTNRLGRRITTVGTMAVCGLGLIVLPYIPRHPGTGFSGGSAFAMAVKFCVTVADSVLHVYGYEVFPTNVRSSSIFFVGLIHGVASILAPELGGTLSSVYVHLAYLMYGGVSLTASLLLLLLPETKDRPLPNKVAEMERTGCPCCIVRSEDQQLATADAAEELTELREQI